MCDILRIIEGFETTPIVSISAGARSSGAAVARSSFDLHMASLNDQIDSLGESMQEQRDISLARMQLLRFEIVDLKSQVANLQEHVAHLNAQLLVVQNPSVPPQAEAPSLSPDHEGES